MKTQSPYQIARLETLAELNALQNEWTDLIEGIPCVPVFQTWEWIRTWWLYFGKDRELWLLTGRDTQGKLVGLAPLMMEINRAGGVKLRKIAFIGTGRVRPVHLNILSRAPNLEGPLYQAFLDFLMDRSDQWDILSITSVAKDTSEYNLLYSAGGRIRAGTQIPIPYIPLPNSWETYLKTLSKHLRRNLKYFRTKLEGDNPGKVEFACITDCDKVDGAMQKLEELNRNRWHAKKLSTAFDDPTYSDFHQAIACLALNRGWLRFYTLTVMDRVIALFYCFHYKDCVYAYQTAFDLEWNAYSPGRLLMAYGIQAAICEGATELDWGPGDSEYKLAWTDQIRLENEILFSSNWRGYLWTKGDDFEGALKIKAKQLLSQSTQMQIKQFLSGRRKIIENHSSD